MPAGNTASTGAISLNDVAVEFGVKSSGTTSSISEFYRGGGSMPGVNTSVPTSGAISLDNFRGIEKASKNTAYYAASTSWTAPAGITKVYVIVAGGGGGGGNGFRNATVNFSGGLGGAGGMAVGGVTVTPGVTYNITIGAGGAGSDGGAGGTGGSSSAFGLSATGGSGGGAATGTVAGSTGASGTGSGGNIANTNIGAWATQIGTAADVGLQAYTMTGLEFTALTRRTSMSNLANNQGTVRGAGSGLPAIAWTSAGTFTGGARGSGEIGGDFSQLQNTGGRAGADTVVQYPATNASGGVGGAVLVFY